MKAIIDQANPGKLLTRYEAVANSSKAVVFTDIPGSLLPAFVDLSLKVKGSTVTSIAFTNKIIHPSDPDYDLIRSMVTRALGTEAGDGKSGDAAPSKPATTPDPDSSDDPTTPEDTIDRAGRRRLAVADSQPGAGGLTRGRLRL